jgi:hypothetical protein
MSQLPVSLIGLLLVAGVLTQVACSGADKALDGHLGDGAPSDARAKDARAEDARAGDTRLGDVRADGGHGAVPPGCTVLLPAPFERNGSPFTAGLSATYSPAGGAADLPDALEIELVEMEPFLQAPGTFDLAAKVDSNYETCNHCVVVYEDQDPDTLDFARTYFQESGTLTLEKVTSDPVSSDAKGSLTGVKLVEVTIDPDTWESTPVQSGKCLFIPAATFDTWVPPGGPCTRPEDCGDAQRKACDPATKTCVLGQCDFNKPPTRPCPEGTSCDAQTGLVAWGACYPMCVPFAPPACAAGFDCVPLLADQTGGECYEHGATAAGAACTSSPLSTSCVAGHRCVEDEAGKTVCLKTCDYFAADPGCGTGTVCILGSVCSSLGGDAAAIGATCAASAASGTFCGSDGKSYRGLCDDSQKPPVCRKACRTSVATDCPGPATCHAWSGGVGDCY